MFSIFTGLIDIFKSKGKSDCLGLDAKKPVKPKSNDETIINKIDNLLEILWHQLAKKMSEFE